MSTNKTPEQRFWEKVDKRGPDECWPWIASLNPDGYGTFGFNGKVIRSHRYSYILHNGPIPEGLLVRHLCGNKLCTNPKHLAVGTKLDNFYDGIRLGEIKNRKKKNGDPIVNKGITREIAIACLNLYNTTDMSAPEIAKIYDVSSKTIKDVFLGKTWTDIPIERHEKLENIRGKRLRGMVTDRDRDLGKLLKELRVSARITREQLAIHSDISNDSIQSAERGARKITREFIEPYTDAINRIMLML